MDDLTFLDDSRSCLGFGHATLKAVLPNGQVDHVSDCIDPHRLLERCPLLYHIFENGPQLKLQASIEAPSRIAVIALLRYCYTGNYLPPGADDEPILLLPHVQVFTMAENFDVPELQLLAHGNFSCQIDYACCLPQPPQDLLETIQFVYAHLTGSQSRQHGTVHTLLNYCISVFQYNKLGESVEFLDLVRAMPDFRQDLCLTNMQRNFQDDCALEVVQLALDTLQSHHAVRPTLLASRDLPAEMLIDSATPPCPAAFDPVRDALVLNRSEDNSDRRSSLSDSAISFVDPTCSGPSTLTLRPKVPQSSPNTGFETDSSSEDEGFSIVHRPKPLPCATPEDLMSSPEIIPSNPKIIDVLALTGSLYPDDDDWTML